MVRHDLSDLPDAAVPAGLAFRPVHDGEGALWTEVIRQAEFLSTIRDGLYEREFGFDPVAARERVYFATDADGAVVGTSGAWYGTEEFADWGRVHWIYLLPGWQGLGLGRALLAFTLRRLAELGHSRAYLTTSTGRRPALRLYLNYGFRPDFAYEDTEAAWRRVAPSLDHPALNDFLSQTR
jgi:GNAT superfamily N-acetyltransferase